MKTAPRSPPRATNVVRDYLDGFRVVLRERRFVGLMIAATCASSAFNVFFAGGPILLPSVDAMVLTPIAPHALSHRPVVLPATATVVLRPLIDPREDIVSTFDGQFGVPLEPGDAIIVTRSPRVVSLLRVTSRSHFDMLREKLRWG